MGDYSDYFEDFPEEDPANYVGERFDPPAAKIAQARALQLAKEQMVLDAEVQGIIQKHTAKSAK